MHNHTNRPPSARLRLVAYLRVSTVGQLDGYGLASQEKDVRRWAKTAGVRIVHVVREGAISGAKDADERPALMDALGWISTGRADGVAAPNLDRVARELTIQEAVLALVWAHGGRAFTADHGEHLEDDDDDPMRTAMRQMRGVFAQLERGLIRKRLKDGRAIKAEAGGYAGGAPRYGLRAEGGELVVDPAEQVGEARATELRAAGLSLQTIAEALQIEGVPTKRGGPWSKGMVARVLDPAYREKHRTREAAARARTREQARNLKVARAASRIGA